MMWQKSTLTRLVVIAAASLLILLTSRWSLQLFQVFSISTGPIVETKRLPAHALAFKRETTTQEMPSRDGLVLPAGNVYTKWNLTCPERHDGEEAGEKAPPLELSLEEAIPCHERTPLQRYERRGDFWVLYNYVPAMEKVRCWETVTYSTQGDVSYLHNLGPLVRRWRAPVSVSLYAPGDDLDQALKGVRWARACLEPPLIERHVSFHMLFDGAHVPAKVPAAADALAAGEPPNCTAEHPYWTTYPTDTTYHHRQKLEYPVNVARNVAREAAATHFVFVSDIEMYPNPGLAPAFLEMVRRDPEVRKPGRRIFVVPPFEVEKGASLPENKSTLLQMLREHRAQPFHETVCEHCHRIPNPQAWVCAPAGPSGRLGVTTVARRVGPYSEWEPFFIGTHADPLYDERLSWDGQKDKMVQAYAMCLMDYEFHILDNAFIVHRPGIYVPKSQKWRSKYIRKTNCLLKSTIEPEFLKVYGKRRGCVV